MPVLHIHTNQSCAPEHIPPLYQGIFRISWLVRPPLAAKQIDDSWEWQQHSHESPWQRTKPWQRIAPYLGEARNIKMVYDKLGQAKHSHQVAGVLLPVHCLDVPEHKVMAHRLQRCIQRGGKEEGVGNGYPIHRYCKVSNICPRCILRYETTGEVSIPDSDTEVHGKQGLYA